MRIIGKITKYVGEERQDLLGYKLLITAVIKAGADPDHDDAYITDEEHLARVGGVSAEDRVEVKPWMERDGRWSFVSSDPRAADLELFAALRSGTEGT